MALELRHYQQAAIEAIWRYFAENAGNPLVVLPTAAGKSLVMSEFIRGVLEHYPDTRFVILTHVQELVAQDYEELMGAWPEAPAGIYSAGLKKRDLKSQVLFCSIQSVHKRAYQIQQADIILIDEAHLIPRKSDTMYIRFLNDLRIINPKCKIVGLTATPFRLDSGMLTDGDGAMFTDICYEASVKALIDEGYLSRPVTTSGHTHIDTSNVGTRGGEFVARELEQAAIDPAVVDSIVEEICGWGVEQDRKGWIVFGTGVTHCTMLRDGIRERGISCEAIFGDTPKEERADIIARFKRREIRCLVSMGVLTTGFNARHVDLVAVVRPTKSVGLWIQMIGRGCRLSPETGKEDFLVLDFGGNIERLGPIDAPIVKRKRAKGEGDEEDLAPTKKCPVCSEQVLIALRLCPSCGHEFPPMVSKVDTAASALSILSAPPKPPEWHKVSRVNYSKHAKPGKPPSMRVDYWCGLSRHSEWICCEHNGYPRQKAQHWWARRMPGTLAPFSVDDAIAFGPQLPVPVEILIRKNGKHTDVIGSRFPGEEGSL